MTDSPTFEQTNTQAQSEGGWNQTTSREPITVHWSIDTGLPQQTPTVGPQPWKVTIQLEYPPDWSLATASSGTAVLERISSQPLILAFDYKGSFPPLGKGPTLDTQWKTPGGPVFFHFDPDMNLETVIEIPVQENIPPPLENPIWNFGLALVAILFFGLVLRWFLRPASLKTIARKWILTQPREGAEWPNWELWLAQVEKDWIKQTALSNGPFSKGGPPQEWTILGAILSNARFGKPKNPDWSLVIGKITILGQLDSLAKLEHHSRR